MKTSDDTQTLAEINKLFSATRRKIIRAKFILLIFKTMRKKIIIFLTTILMVIIIGIIFCIFYYYNKDINQKNINYQNKEKIIFGNYGPYNFEDISAISVSDNNWGVIFQNQGKHHILINNKNKGAFNNIGGITDFRVTDNFYGFQYRIKDAKGFYIKINDKDYGPFDNNVELLISNNYWAIKYFNKTSQHNKAIVNGENYDNYAQDIAVSDDFWGIVYSTKGEGYHRNYFVIINDKKYGATKPYQYDAIALCHNELHITHPTTRKNVVLSLRI